MLQDSDGLVAVASLGVDGVGEDSGVELIILRVADVVNVGDQSSPRVLDTLESVLVVLGARLHCKVRLIIQDSSQTSSVSSLDAGIV